jgi:hypothetical protein
MLSALGANRLSVLILICLDNYSDPSVVTLSALMILGSAGVIVLADRWFGLAKLV